MVLDGKEIKYFDGVIEVYNFRNDSIVVFDKTNFEVRFFKLFSPCSFIFSNNKVKVKRSNFIYYNNKENEIL